VPRRKTERSQTLVKPTAAERSQSYAALVTAIAQAHDHAQRPAVHYQRGAGSVHASDTLAVGRITRQGLCRATAIEEYAREVCCSDTTDGL
jgi:hypothetical protein